MNNDEDNILEISNDLLSIVNKHCDKDKLTIFLAVSQIYLDIIETVFDEQTKNLSPLHYNLIHDIKSKIRAFITFLLNGDLFLIKDKNGNVL